MLQKHSVDIRLCRIQPPAHQSERISELTFICVRLLEKWGEQWESHSMSAGEIQPGTFSLK